MRSRSWLWPSLGGALLVVAVWFAGPGQVSAQFEPPTAAPSVTSTINPAVRSAYYRRLARSPWAAAGWDLLVPGAGNIYTRIYVNTLVTWALTLAGGALWIHGAVADNDTTWWAGVGAFSGGRLYGVTTSFGGAVLYNRAVARQLGARAAGTFRSPFVTPSRWVVEF